MEQTYLAAFVTALPPYARAKLTINQQVIANVHRAEQNGWTTKQLVDEVMRNHNGAVNPGGIIAHRLARCAEGPPVAPSGSGLAKVHDGCCEAGWRYDDDAGTATKCPGVRT